MLAIMGIIAAGASLLGGVASAVAVSKESRAKEEAARSAADQVRKETQWKIGDLQTQQKQFMGTQQAMIGRSGVKLTSGSPLALMGETSRRMAEDVRRMYQQGEWDAEAMLEEADLYKKTRPWQVGGSLLSGLSSGAGSMMGAL